VTIALLAAGRPPTCLAPFTVTAGTLRSAQTARFGLSSASGVGAAEVHGFSLASLHDGYNGPPTFVAPLSLRWKDSDTPILLLDAAVHGYHAHFGGAAAFRGSTEPCAWRCTRCQEPEFVPQVTFFYGAGVEDLWKDEPDLPIQDYFTHFSLDATCLECGTAQLVADLDT